MEKYRHLDLFSGIGGWCLGFQAMGFETVGVCEREPYPQKILKQHFPNATLIKDVHDDFTRFQFSKLKVITASPPCQPYSNAGKQRGDSDDRALWPRTLEIVEQLRPPYFIFENVPGMVRLALDNILLKLETLSYWTHTYQIPASALGSWHQRDRIWIICYTKYHGPSWAEELRRTGQTGYDYSEGEIDAIESSGTGQRRDSQSLEIYSKSNESSLSNSNGRGVEIRGINQSNENISRGRFFGTPSGRSDDRGNTDSRTDASLGLVGTELSTFQNSVVEGLEGRVHPSTESKETSRTTYLGSTGSDARHCKEETTFFANSECVGRDARTDFSKIAKKREKPSDVGVSSRRHGEGQLGARLELGWKRAKTFGKREADGTFTVGYKKQWAIEPGILRVSNGVPNRVDRIKGLGNAIVVQHAMAIAEAIMKVEKRKEKRSK